MKEYREALELILSGKVRLVTVDVEKEFLHLDKNKDGSWTFVITKSLLNE
jgi:hypothetical protein